jgi:hypothetical protein
VRDVLLTAVFFLLLLVPAFVVDWALQDVLGPPAAHGWATAVLVLTILSAGWWGRKRRLQKSAGAGPAGSASRWLEEGRQGRDV